MTTEITTEITEGDWKTLATTEITHLTDEEKDYLPRAWDEWIARVKRDAKAEAWDEGYLDRSPYGGRARSRADNPYRATETGDRA